MPGRGETQKQIGGQAIVLERKMVTRYYRLTWDLERCVGCDIGPTVCPKEAVIHVPGKIENGRLVEKPAVDIDSKKCVFCGICEVMCPKKAITLTINDKRENPVLVHEAFAVPTEVTTFDPAAFDWQRREFVIDSCPTRVISYDDEARTLLVDDAHCIRCRQCEIASNGAFQVVQPWEGRVELHRERCVEGCLACADICPTRALHIDAEDGEELALADYYCIKCGACMQVCPVRPEYEELEATITSQGVTKTVRTKRLINAEQLPVRVERWRIKHQPVQSAAWLDALKRLADDKAGAVEIDRKRALRRRDLLKALMGSKNHLR
jgi:ferredoxin